MMPFPRFPDHLVRQAGHVKQRAYGDLAKVWANTVRLAVRLDSHDYDGLLYHCEGILPHHSPNLSWVPATSPTDPHSHGGVVCSRDHVLASSVSSTRGVTCLAQIPSNIFRILVSRKLQIFPKN